MFQDEDDDGRPCIFRVVQTRAAGDDNYVSYVPHFQFPDSTPPELEWLFSRHSEVKEWHDASRAALAQHSELQPPTTMQDTAKTLEIYAEALYPTLREWGMDEIVEDNASPHNNDAIRQSHRDNNVRIVGYSATPAEKEEIKDLIRTQVSGAL